MQTGSGRGGDDMVGGGDEITKAVRRDGDAATKKRCIFGDEARMDLIRSQYRWASAGVSWIGVDGLGE